MNQVDSVQQQRTGSVCLEEKVRMKRLHQPQDVVLKQTAVSPADVQLLVIKKEIPDEWSFSVDQQDPETFHIKEEQEELWASPEGEQLSGQEETDITRLTFTADQVKSEDEEKPQSLEPHQSQREDNREEEPATSSSAKQIKTESDRADCGGPETGEKPNTNSHIQPNTDGKSSDSSEMNNDEEEEEEEELEDDDWQEPLSDFGPETKDGDNGAIRSGVTDVGSNTDRETFGCSECGKKFLHKRSLWRHMKCRSGKSLSSCSVYKKCLEVRQNVDSYIRDHTGKKLYECDFCGQRFTRQYNLNRHKRVHTGEKPFACNVCRKGFSRPEDLKPHMRAHTGEKPFKCTVCGKGFSHKFHMKRHLSVHTEEKPVDGGERLTYKESLERHMETVASSPNSPLAIPKPEEKLETECPGAHQSQDSINQTAVLPADVQQLLVIKEEVPIEWSASLDQQDPEPLRIKEEQEELWTSQEGEQLNGQKETDITRLTLTAVSMKSEDDEGKPQSSQLHQSQSKDNSEADLSTSSSAEQMKTESNGQYWGGPEPARSPVSNGHFEPNTDEKDSSETEVSDSDDDDVGDGNEDDVDDGQELFSDSGPATEDSENSHWVPEAGANTSKSLKSKHSLQRHVTCLVNVKQNVDSLLRSHTGEKSFDCDVLVKQIRHHYNFKSHIKNHIGKKQFVCGICSESFTQQKNLKRHMRVHTGEKPYSCHVCAKRFTQQGVLKRHLRVHSGEKPFGCDFCGKRFTQQGVVKRHMRVHTGEKPYSCDLCGKNFVHHHDLKIHIRAHTGEKRFNCGVCGTRFTQQGSLKRHMRSHTGEKPFVCNVCGKTFTQQGSLNRHLRNHTGVEGVHMTTASSLENESMSEVRIL